MADSGRLEILCSNGLAGGIAEVARTFEQDSGHKLAVRLGTANALKKEIEDGAPFDVAILTAPIIDELIVQGKVAAGTRADIARSRVAMTVRPGAPKPDISTVEAFKAALVAAKSIVYTSQGASGQYFASLLPRLGIEEEIERKATIPAGGLVAEAVVRGEVEIGIQQVSEIMAVPGAVLVGPIPEELQKYTVFSAGLAPHAAESNAAKSLIALLRAPSTLAMLKAKGMEPV